MPLTKGQKIMRAMEKLTGKVPKKPSPVKRTAKRKYEIHNSHTPP